MPCRDLLELNFKAAQWTCGAVWNRWYMDPKPGRDMRQMWQDHETEIQRNVTSVKIPKLASGQWDEIDA
jgi:hypothetical protein